jgi:hypothetical protein
MTTPKITRTAAQKAAGLAKRKAGRRQKISTARKGSGGTSRGRSTSGIRKQRKY